MTMAQQRTADLPIGQAMQAEPDDAEAFSPVENEAPLRWWRRLRLARTGDLGTGRRAVLLAAIAWLPIAIWALVTGRLLSGTAEPLMVHYGIHVRCLIVIPLLIMAEEALHRSGRGIAQQFVTSGTVPPALRPGFDAVLRDVARLRDTSLPWVFAIGVAIAWTIANPPTAHVDELNWAIGPDGVIGFGAAWFAYVVRPLLTALLLGWLWRLLLVTWWMWRIARLPLALVVTHPDRTGGIGFVKSLPRGFTLVTIALSAMMASRWAHEVGYHGALLTSFEMPLIAYVVLWSLALMLPLFALAPALYNARKRALPGYAALVGGQGRLIQRRWIEHRPVDDSSLLEAEGIGVAADAAALYQSVRDMQFLPIGKHTLIAILVPMVIPFLVLPLLRFPIDAILAALFRALL
jgi:hypothetical protein